jgi:AhpD family alkylhydroperoxidase
MDEHVKRLIAIGASIGANCHPCVEYHIGKALEDGIEKNEILEVIEAAKAVRRGAAASMDKLMINLLNDETPEGCKAQKSSCSCS